jgi:hypothetical protein
MEKWKFLQHSVNSIVRRGGGGGGVSIILTIKYGLEFRGTALARLAATVNYSSVLSSERALQNDKPATVQRKFQAERKIGHRSQTGA